jgi:cell wall-associated NlpC family hydrolase
MSAEDIIAAARECLGTPFRHQGREPGRALDCLGVVVHVARARNHTHQDAAGYARTPAPGLLEAGLAGQVCLYRVPLVNMQPGDVLLMRFSREPQHLAVFTGEGIIHAYQAIGRCVEHRLDDKWRKRIVSAWRFRNE